MKKLDIKTITAPCLNQPEYGKNLEQQFRNIDENFRILSNQDFVKGAKGDSVAYKSVPLITLEKDQSDKEVKKFTTEGIQVLDAIMKEFCGSTYYNVSALTGISEKDLKNGLKLSDLREALSNISWRDDLGDLPNWSYLLNTNDGKKDITFVDIFDNPDPSIFTIFTFNVIQVYDPEEAPTQYEPVATVNSVIFRDYRFASRALSNEKELEKLSGLVDTSCSIHGQLIGGGYTFEILHDLPSLYYDKINKSFCWKIGGVNTGLIAQGPQGFNGSDGHLYVLGAINDQDGVSVNNKGDMTWADNNIITAKYYLAQVGEASAWVPLNSEYAPELPNGCACIVCTGLKENDNNTIEIDNSSYSIIFGNMVVDKSITSKPEAVAVVTETNCILPRSFHVADFENILTQNIMVGEENPSNAIPNKIRGLHIPMNDPEQGSGNKIHGIYNSPSSTEDFVLNIKPCTRDSNNLNKWTHNSDQAALEVGYRKCTFTDGTSKQILMDFANSPILSITDSNPSIEIRKIGNSSFKLFNGSKGWRMGSSYPLTIYSGTHQLSFDDNSTNSFVNRISGGSLSLQWGDGTSDSSQMRMSSYQIQQVDGGGFGNLSLNPFGGSVTIGEKPKTSVNTSLTVYGATALRDTLNVIGKTTLSSTLEVAGATTLQDTLNVIGKTTLKTLEVTNDSTFNNTATFNNNLIVNGSTTIKNGLLVNSTATISSKLVVGNTNGDPIVSYGGIFFRNTWGAWESSDVDKFRNADGAKLFVKYSDVMGIDPNRQSINTKYSYYPSDRAVGVIISSSTQTVENKFICKVGNGQIYAHVEGKSGNKDDNLDIIVTDIDGACGLLPLNIYVHNTKSNNWNGRVRVYLTSASNSSAAMPDTNNMATIQTTIKGKESISSPVLFYMAHDKTYKLAGGQ